ncbi:MULTISPECIES: endonuclease/exonuclease/phosphatase family protein [unclassified Pasteurella]|uniref:endonuclease/exonuclease/phosphatase family protein n=1 Tax=unclassified Pasteurella TaxID=2621516 RepID=UPI00107383AC|nr:endonuclease/exonuclease/phosphatase family protein [Pasteurella sp. 19428wF3_WM03]TFU51354.1 endonuclease/exonuclease/phosphatase family protein [Pasteurella sp. WM03]
MRKRTKIFIFVVLLGMLAGMNIFNPLRIFNPIQITLESTFKTEFKAINEQCFVNQMQFQTLEKTRIRLLSWNIHKGEDSGWRQDLARFSQEQDLVLLQEATPEQDLPSFSSALFVSSFAYKGRPSGVKSFSKWIPMNYCGISQSEPWIYIPKVASVMRFPLKNDDELVVINAHLINFEWTPKAYQAQLAQIFSLIPSPQSAVILAGDFNAWNEERKQMLNEFITQAGLNEVSFSPDERRRFFNYPLDFVFVRGMNVELAKTTQVASSDHAPIWVELTLE